MAAYIVFMREGTSNKEEMEIYTQLALPTLHGRNVNARAFYGRLDVLEGPTFEGAVILEFPSASDAKAWYQSPEYQAAAEHRRTGATFRVFIVEGTRS